MSVHCKEQRPNHSDVEMALVNLLAAYSDYEGPLSDWERHCLSLAMVFERHGYFDKALTQIGQVLEPPFPLPAFPKPEPLSIEDIRRTLRAEKRH